ncbi:MAG: GNAT family N-acetyltransferase [Pseudomonadota bacterium]
MLKPTRLLPDSDALPHVLSLIQRSFAFMDGRIDPPSSMHSLTVEAIAEQCRDGEVWTLDDPIAACIFLTPKPEALYVGKLAVDEPMRGRGMARLLIRHAELRALELNLPELELETRVELTEIHRAFDRMGFTKTADGMHDGYDRPTFIIMRKPV